MVLRSRIYAVILTLLLPFRLLAWGHKGHEIVARLAINQISNETRQKVLQVFGGMTPEQAGTWMDDVRSEAAYKYTAPWHYTNIEPGSSYQPAAAGDIITALNKAYVELQHMDTLGPERLRFDVLVLFHLCGDLTQPLHVGYGSDKGGNDYQVQYNGKGTNLHHIWDTDIIESQGISIASFTDSINTPAAVANHKLWAQRGFFMVGLNAGRHLLPAIYGFSGHKLDEAYMRKNKPVVESQLLTASNLLAACLEQLFSKVDKVPIVPIGVTDMPQSKNTDSVYRPFRDNTIEADQAANHIGETLKVCGKVYSAKFTGGTGVTFINMGGEYPNNPFTAVIMFKDRSNFSYKPEEYLSGKTICVTGTVQNYKGKPEIVVVHQENILLQ